MKLFSMVFLILGWGGGVFADDAHNLCANPPNQPGSLVSFPADDATHLNPDGSMKYVYEQWYWNAILNGTHGKKYGIEALPFQFTFGPTSITVIQISITDLDTNEYHSQFVWGNGTDPYTHVTDGFEIDRMDGTGHFRATGGAGRDHLTFEFSDGTYADIRFEGLKHPTPAWFDGFGALVDPVTGKNHGEQFYYNRRNMLAYGQVSRPGKPTSYVLGTGWYDREFGTVIGTPGTQADNVNWKWLSLHLSDGSDYMVWDIKANDTGNSLIHVINKIGPVPACEEKRITDYSFVATGSTAFSAGPPPSTFDTSTHLSVPEENLELDITMLGGDQIVESGGLFSPFLEGAITATGTKNGHPIHANGYYEQFVNPGGCCQGL